MRNLRSTCISQSNIHRTQRNINQTTCKGQKYNGTCWKLEDLLFNRAIIKWKFSFSTSERETRNLDNNSYCIVLKSKNPLFVF